MDNSEVASLGIESCGMNEGGDEQTFHMLIVMGSIPMRL